MKLTQAREIARCNKVPPRSETLLSWASAMLSPHVTKGHVLPAPVTELAPARSGNLGNVFA